MMFCLNDPGLLLTSHVLAEEDKEIQGQVHTVISRAGKRALVHG